jgi:hypothetical protein
MNADTVLAEIRAAVGDPSCGPIKDAWPLIEGAVRQAMGGAPAAIKETRIIKAQETPEG